MLSAADDYLKQHGIMDPLGKRLGQMVPYDTPVGRISPYFSLRYGVSAEAVVLAGTGDNPATLLGCGGMCGKIRIRSANRAGILKP